MLTFKLSETEEKILHQICVLITLLFCYSVCCNIPILSCNFQKSKLKHLILEISIDLINRKRND